MEKTRITLLQRMKKDGSGRAWEEFYERYAPVILNYAKKRGIAGPGAEDVLQETMMALLRELPDFIYDPAKGLFRNYLLTIVHKRCVGAQRRAKRDGRMFEQMQPHAMEQMVDVQAMTADREIESAWQRSMEDEAWRLVSTRSEHDPRSIAVYEAHVRRGRPPAEVALEFGLTVNHVYQLKNQIAKKVLKELEMLLEGLGEEAGGP